MLPQEDVLLKKPLQMRVRWEGGGIGSTLYRFNRKKNGKCEQGERNTAGIAQDKLSSFVFKRK